MRNPFFLIISLILIACQNPSEKKQEKILEKNQEETKKQSQENNTPQDTIKELAPEILILQKAYPDFVKGGSGDTLFWKDGTFLLIEDGKTKKSFEEFLNTSDIKEQFLQKYPLGTPKNIPEENFDPGRIRNEAFFKKMYGNSAQEVEQNLVTVQWLPNSVNISLRVTKINGVDKKLKAVSDELEKYPEFLRYFDNPAGTFYWRQISGTNRLSMHSFGIAIDINVNYSNYWRWQQGTPKYKNKIPMKIVEVFEKHGFIWGGSWYHYDTMHFEYRPELLIDLKE